MDPTRENLSDPVGRDADAAITDRTAEQSAVAGAATATAPAMQQTGRRDAVEGVAEGSSGNVPYFSTGKAFTDWFNDKVRQLPNPSVTLGTKQAHAMSLLPDGRLKCTLVGGEGDGEPQYVAFEGQYLDQLVRKIAAIGL